MHIIILTNILVSGAWHVVSGFVGSAACLPPVVRSSIIAPAGCLASTAADGLAVTSGLVVGTRLRGVKDHFHDGRNIVLGQVLLPATLNRQGQTH